MKGWGKARRVGAVLALGVALVVPGMSGAASAQSYPPNGGDFPSITLDEGPADAAGLPALKVPPPKPDAQQSIWNMKVVGFNDAQARPSA